MIISAVIAVAVVFFAVSWYVDRRRRRRNARLDAQGLLDPAEGGLVAEAEGAAKASERPFATEQATAEATAWILGRHGGRT